MRKFAIFMMLLFLTGCSTTSKEVKQNEVKPETNVEMESTNEVTTEVKLEETPTEVDITDYVEPETIATVAEGESKHLTIHGKEDYTSTDLVSSEYIDLTATSDLELSKFDSLEEEDLNITLFNRKITVTGTKLSSFIDTFGDFNWANAIKDSYEMELAPCSTLKYIVTFPDGMNNYLTLSIFNSTDSNMLIKDCSIYGIIMANENGLDSIKVNRQSTENKSFEENGYGISTSKNDKHNSAHVLVSPYLEATKWYWSNIDSVRGISELQDKYEVGSNYVRILDNTVDFNNIDLASLMNTYTIDTFVEVPEFYINLDFYNKPVFEDKLTGASFAGDGFCTILLDSNDIYKGSVYANLGNSKRLPNTNLYKANIESLFSNRINQTNEFDTEVYNFGGITNLTTDVSPWLDNVSTLKHYCTEDISDILPIELSTTVFVNAPIDSSFIVPNGFNFSYGYTLRPIRDGYYEITLFKDGSIMNYR